jgi:TPR repeat protein
MPCVIARVELEWRPLAEQGHADFQYILGLMREQGKEIETDIITAYMWFNIANIGGQYAGGEGMRRIEGMLKPSDISEAQRRARAWKPRPRMESDYRDCD